MNKRKRKQKPQTGWCLFMYDRPLINFCRHRKRYCIDAAVTWGRTPWADMKKEGYSCRRIVITEVKANEETK